MNYDVIKSLNPWKDTADEWLHEMQTGGRPYEYILPEDDLALRSYARSEKARQKLVLDIPPQPFVGRPESSIWLLLNNPGSGGEWDKCDFLSGTNALSAEEKICASSVADMKLDARQALYCEQLKLLGKPDEAFILLNPAFKTVARTGRRHARNIYTWYHAQLFPRTGFLNDCVDVNDEEAVCRFVSRNLFVLDYFPYRSHAYDRKSPMATHVKFWNLLVKNALEDGGKLIIMRKWIRDVILCDSELQTLYLAAVKSGRMIVAENERLWFTEKNFKIEGRWREIFDPYLKR